MFTPTYDMALESNGNNMHLINVWASQVALVVKKPPANAGDIRDVGLIPGLGRYPGVEYGTALQLFLPGKFHEQRSLVSYSPWGHKESDTTSDSLVAQTVKRPPAMRETWIRSLG